ncbi:hypothetical protein E8E91_07785 [Pseudomonas sp. BN515]|nr:hypothetical protein [Pseudomonas sp. BN515]
MESRNKDDVRGLYVQVPDALPSGKSPSRHASFRWLGEPDHEVRRILDEQLKAEPNWYWRSDGTRPADGPGDQGAGLFRVVRSGVTQGQKGCLRSHAGQVRRAAAGSWMTSSSRWAAEAPRR